MDLKEKIIQYLDAGFPILYINSYEEQKVDEIISESSAGREIIEWNGFSGCWQDMLRWFQYRNQRRAYRRGV